MKKLIIYICGVLLIATFVLNISMQQGFKLPFANPVKSDDADEISQPVAAQSPTEDYVTRGELNEALANINMVVNREVYPTNNSKQPASTVIHESPVTNIFTTNQYYGTTTGETTIIRKGSTSGVSKSNSRTNNSQDEEIEALRSDFTTFSTTQNGSGQWSTNGTDVFRTTGNVGIGTSTPSSLLTVAGNGLFTGTVNAANFINSGNSTTTGASIASFFTATTPTATSTFAGGLTVNGNVGIGPTAPTSKLFVSNTAQASGMTSNISTVQTTPNAGDTSDGSLFVDYSLTASSATNELVSRVFRLNVNNNLTGGGTVQNARLINVAAGSAAGTLTTNLDAIFIETSGGAGTVTNGRGIVVNNLAGTSQAGLVVGLLAGSSNITHVLLGTNTIPTGNYGIYQFAGYQNYFSGNVGIGSTTPTAKLAITGAGASTGITFRTTNSSNVPTFTILDNGNVGVGTTSPLFKFHVKGDDGSGNVAKFETTTGGTACTLNASTGLINCSSDRNLKKDIESLMEDDEDVAVLDKLMELNPVSYHWKTDESSDDLKYGFIAQEVEDIFPTLVSTDSTTKLKSLSLNGFVPFIVSGMQEMYKKVSSLFDGLGNIFVRKVKIKEELCFDDICINKEEFRELIEKNNISNTPDELETEPETEETPVVEEGDEEEASEPEAPTEPVAPAEPEA